MRRYATAPQRIVASDGHIGPGGTREQRRGLAFLDATRLSTAPETLGEGRSELA